MGNVGGGSKPPVTVPPPVQVPGDIPPPPPMPPDTPLSLPGASNTGNSGNGHTTVSTDAIRVFASRIELLEAPVRTALDGMTGVDLRPGAFHQAFVLANEIEGEGELRDSTRIVLTNALDALVEIRRSCHRLIAEYDTAEELNSADATRFQELVLGAQTVIADMGAKS